MTYLDICNKVLRLMREDTVASVQVPDDVVVELVKDFVNDAKRLVEDAHSWNMLRDQWTVSTTAGNPLVSVTGAGKYVVFSDVYNTTGGRLQECTNRKMAYLKSESGADNVPYYYAVNGIDGNGDVRLRLHPTPDAVYTLSTEGFKKQADLSLDADELLVPAQPVVYYALALALRERGEVGGQTAAEVFGMAKQYLSDAIALDASLNQYEYDWYAN